LKTHTWIFSPSGDQRGHSDPVRHTPGRPWPGPLRQSQRGAVRPGHLPGRPPRQLHDRGPRPAPPL